MPFVRAARQARGDRRLAAGDAGADRRCVRRCERTARRRGVRRPATRLRLLAGRRTRRPNCRRRGPRAARAGGDIERAAALLAGAERPVIMAGSDLYWAHGENALRELAHELGIPVFQNGLARGCVAADDPLAFSRVRSTALGGADVALIVGVPLDFRLAFGAVFDEQAQLIVVDSAAPERPHPRDPGRRVLRRRCADAAGAARGGGHAARRRCVGCRAARTGGQPARR